MITSDNYQVETTVLSERNSRPVNFIHCWKHASICQKIWPESEGSRAVLHRVWTRFSQSPCLGSREIEQWQSRQERTITGGPQHCNSRRKHWKHLAYIRSWESEQWSYDRRVIEWKNGNCKPELNRFRRIGQPEWWEPRKRAGARRGQGEIPS